MFLPCFQPGTIHLHALEACLNLDPVEKAISRPLLQVCTPWQESAPSGAGAVLRRSLTIALSEITGCSFQLIDLSLLNHAQAPHAPWMCILHHAPWLAILFVELSFNQLSAPCSNPAVFWLPFSSTIRYHHDLSMTLDWVHSFIQPSTICWILCAGILPGAGLQWRTRHNLCFFSSRSTCAMLCMGDNYSFQCLWVFCLFCLFYFKSSLVSKLIIYLCLAVGGPLSRETLGAIQC